MSKELKKSRIVNDLKRPFDSSLAFVFKTDGHEGFSMCDTQCACAHGPHSAHCGGQLGPNVPTQDCESLIKAKIVNELKILIPFLTLLQPLVSRQLDLKASLCVVYDENVSMDPIQDPWGRHMGPNLPLQDCESPVKATTVN